MVSTVRLTVNKVLGSNPARGRDYECYSACCGSLLRSELCVQQSKTIGNCECLCDIISSDVPKTFL